MPQGKYYQPTIHPEDINATPRTGISQEQVISAVAGCPCDDCYLYSTCQVECSTFNYWVNKGPTKAQKEAALKAAEEK